MLNGKTENNAENISEILREIDITGKPPGSISERPGAFMRDFYEAFRENGGLAGGKPRNSIRQMRHVWLVDENIVRSLHPKLVGQVKLTRQDAGRLVDLFLSRWKFVGSRRKDPEVTSDGYLPFGSKDCHRLRALIVEALFPPESEQLSEGLLLPRKSSSTVLEVPDSGDPEHTIAKSFYEAATIITISRQNTVIGPNPQESMRTFWNFMNQIYNESQQDKKSEKVLIWVLDIGRKIAEEESSYYEYYNCAFLSMLLHCFANFYSVRDQEDQLSGRLARKLRVPNKSRRQERWNWLASHGAIVLQNSEPEEIHNLYDEVDKNLREMRLNDIGVTHEHMLPSSTPLTWGRSLEKLYGKDGGDIAKATLAVFLQRQHEPSDSAPPDLTYMAVKVATHTDPAVAVEIEDMEWSIRGERLTSPGPEFDQAFEILDLAARHRLQMHQTSGDGDDSEGAIALAYAQRLGFEVLRVHDFMKIFSNAGYDHR